MTEPQRRRRRPAVSCTLCRKRKIRCNREVPCSNCLRSRATCVYETLSPPPSPRRRVAELAPRAAPCHQYPSPVSTASSGTVSVPSSAVTVPAAPCSPDHLGHTSRPLSMEFEAMRARINQLEEQLSRSSQGTHKATSSTLHNSLMGTFHLRQESHSPNAHDTDAVSQSVAHKGRVFGQSHWLNAIVQFRDLFDIMETQLQGERPAAVVSIERCKRLARAIKIQRAPSWPSAPARELPAKPICDRLIDCYLQTTESIHRILHIPSFMQEYESIWIPNAKPDPGFLVQLKLVLANGSTAYDDTFSLRTSAVHWIYEAQTWLCEPEFKSRLTIRSLQVNILLLIARKSVNIGGTLVWLSAGDLLRTAIYMGLNKDPSGPPSRSTYTCEMHRRLWHTVLEIVLQTSLDSGGPPLIGMGDYDTQCPQNLDDEDLLIGAADPRPDEEHTQTSIARAFWHALPVRLAILKYLNDFGSKATYKETLKLDKELREAQRTMSRALQASCLGAGHTAFDVGSTMANFLLATYIFALHTPFLPTAFREPTHAFSRMALLDTSLKLWPIVCPSSTLAAQAGSNGAHANDIWRRLTVCDQRIFYVAVKHSTVAVLLELREQFQDGEGLGAAPFRPDLLSILQEGRTWSLEGVKAGETNIKGYLVSCVAFAHAEALRRGLQKEEMAKCLVQATGDAADICLPFLEEMLRQEKGEDSYNGEQDVPETPSDSINWEDIWMSDAQDEFGGWDPLTWVLGDESIV